MEQIRKQETEKEECSAEELCRQYMGRAKESITIAGQRLHLMPVEKDLTESVIEMLIKTQTDISMAIFQVGRVYEQIEKPDVIKV